MPLWNSRFRRPLAESALRYSSSIEYDKKLFQEDIEGSKAHVRMLVKQKIISASDGRAILRGLDAVRKEIETGKLSLDWRKEDIHTAIEERLVKRIGSKGKKLHTARSRNDQVALDERLCVRKQIAEIRPAIGQVQRALVKQAEKHQRTSCPGYTHLQRAQPIPFAHHLLAYVAMLQRDAERFADCLKRVNRSPLGAGALAGTALQIDRAYVARQLNMDGVLENSIDAVSDRDYIVEFVSACSLTMMHLSRFAEELVIWNTEEFGFVRIDDTFTTGSSLMPQKKNPDIAELLRGKVGRVYGALIALLTVLKALPLSYNRDLQEDKEPLFDAAGTTLSSLRITAELVRHSSFHKNDLAKQLDGSLTLATDLAEYLVRKGVPFRDAHRIVGQVVMEAERRGKKLDRLPLTFYKKKSPKFESDVFAVLSAEANIGNRKSSGSASYGEVRRQLRRWKRILNRK